MDDLYKIVYWYPREQAYITVNEQPMTYDDAVEYVRVKRIMGQRTRTYLISYEGESE